MRLLLDECVPRPLRRQLPGHEVSTVGDEGWSGKRNSELLKLVRGAGFDGFVTVDQNLEFQQDIARSGLTVIVVSARTNRLKDLLPLAPAILDGLAKARKGQITRVGA